LGIKLHKKSANNYLKKFIKNKQNSFWKDLAVELLKFSNKKTTINKSTLNLFLNELYINKSYFDVIILANIMIDTNSFNKKTLSYLALTYKQISRGKN